MHGQSVLIVRVRSGKRSTISELYWPSLRPLYPALFAVKFKNSFPTFAIQTSPADPQIDRDVTLEAGTPDDGVPKKKLLLLQCREL
jgi:hypothetical protein